MELKEAKELAISAIVLALAFSIAAKGGIAGIALLTISNIAVSLILISLGFLLHEMGHRFLARRFGSYAEYKMWPQGLALALLLSMFGFIFAAPGAVVIHSRADLWGRSRELTRKMSGMISIVGPAINVLLAIAFFMIGFLYPAHQLLLNYGASINIWLALFNMFPIPPLDGSKVFSWDRRIWIISVAAILIFSGIL